MNPERAWVDEEDIALIDAVHLSPRASYTQLAQTLGISAATAARRWRRLTASGEAWVSSVPGPAFPFTGALVNVSCRPPDIEDVGRSLARLAPVVSIHVTGGQPAMYALVITADPALMADLLLRRMAEIPGVTSVAPMPMVELFAGRTWTLGALSRTQRSTVRVDSPLSPDVGVALTDLDRKLFVALQTDGRGTSQELAGRLDLPEHTVRRRLDALQRDGVLAFRTDFVRPAAGWPVQVVAALDVPDGAVAEVGQELAAWPETRVCASVVGAANLLVTLQLHQMQALHPLLARVRGRWPDARILERRLVMRSVKSWGRILDTSGRAVEVVPVDPWNTDPKP